jgi:integrase
VLVVARRRVALRNHDREESRHGDYEEGQLMPRPATGQVIERKTRSGVTSYALRFRAYGKRQFVHLGYAPIWTRRRAEEELANVLADVRRGLWAPPEQSAPAPPPEVPTFHVFASEWVAGREAAGLRPRTLEYLRWALTDHLLPHFAEVRVDRVTIEEVDRYARHKTAEGRLSNGSVNKTVDVLSAVLEAAVEYEYLARNPAKGKRRRLPTTKPARTFLDRADHVGALLEAAGELDGAALARRGQRRALLATLAFAGPRIGELLALTWREVDLARGTIAVHDSKTAAGVRVVNVLPILRDELLAYRATLRDVLPSALVFATSTGGRQSETNVRRRVLAPAVERASKRLEAEGIEPLPEGLTPHSLRRTFASVLIALGEDPAYVIGQLGHTNPSLTLRLYAKAMGRRDGERERLRALVEGREWAPMGTSHVLEGWPYDARTAS